MLERMCGTRMHVLFRLPNKESIAIRAQFEMLGKSGHTPVVLFDQISVKGQNHLKGSKSVRVEVLGMPSQVVFKVPVVKMLPGKVALGVPREIVSIERRNNVRYTTSPRNIGYLSLDSWEPLKDDNAAPPMIPPNPHFAGWIPIADISLGGVCALTGFPRLLNILDDAGDEPLAAKLILPMNNPHPVSMHSRWQKRTINRVVEGGAERPRLEFRVGLEFHEPDEAAETLIRQFIRQLSIGDAV